MATYDRPAGTPDVSDSGRAPRLSGESQTSGYEALADTLKDGRRVNWEYNEVLKYKMLTKNIGSTQTITNPTSRLLCVKCRKQIPDSILDAHTVIFPLGANDAISYSRIPNHVTRADSMMASVITPYAEFRSGATLALLLEREMQLRSQKKRISPA